jgi:hypothetical protein
VTLEIQAALTMGMPTLAVLISISVDDARLGSVNRRMREMRSHLDHRFDDLEGTLRSDFRHLEERLR